MTREFRGGKRATVVDVARQAGVSVGTVSHVLSGARYVRPDTRERVEAAIQDLGFTPNRVAQSLISNRTMTIGLVVPDMANLFIAELARGVEDTVSAAGYALQVGNNDDDPDRQARYFESIGERRVDGLILTPAFGSKQDSVTSLSATIPIVLVSRVFPGWIGDAVVEDNEAGMRLLVRHVLGLGHEQIALVNGDKKHLAAQQREATLISELEAVGRHPVWVSNGEFTFESGMAQAQELFRQGIQPTAICATNDLLALGVLAAALGAGFSVPEDLSVTGYDDTVFARLSQPALTTAAQPTRAMGTKSASLLLERLGGHPGPAQRVVLSPRLVVRGSTAPPKRVGS